MADVQFSGLAAKFTGTTEAAVLLGVSGAFLRKLCTGQPPLPHRKVADAYQIVPGEAYDFIRQHARRHPPGLQPPPGYAQAPISETPPPSAELPADPHALLLRLLTDPIKREQFSAEQLRTFATIAAELRRKDESDAKAAAYVKPEEVAEFLQDHRALYVEEIDGSAPADAAELLRYIRAEFNVDLNERNIAAARLLESFLRQRANKVIAAVSKRVEEQVKGVRLLEFGGA